MSISVQRLSLRREQALRAVAVGAGLLRVDRDGGHGVSLGWNLRLPSHSSGVWRAFYSSPLASPCRSEGGGRVKRCSCRGKSRRRFSIDFRRRRCATCRARRTRSATGSKSGPARIPRRRSCSSRAAASPTARPTPTRIASRTRPTRSACVAATSRRCVMENRPEFLATWMGLAKLGRHGGAAQYARARSRASSTRSRRPEPTLVVVGSECARRIREPRTPRAQRRFPSTSRATPTRPRRAAPRPATGTRCSRAPRTENPDPRGARRPPRRRRSLLHLHLGHDGAAQGRASLAHALARRRRRHVGDRRLRTRRRDRLRAAALSRRRRHGGGLERARAGRDDVARAPLLGEPLLGRRAPLRRHRLPVRRRDLPLPGEPARAPRRPRAPRARDDGRRAGPRHLGGVRSGASASRASSKAGARPRRTRR